jgi:hypothetical protein
MVALSPGLTLTGTGSFPLVVNGSGFVDGAEILWNGNPRSTRHISSTSLSVQIQRGDIAYPVDAWISVRNPDGSVSDSLPFSAVTVLPAPIRPVLECVTRERTGGFTAWFGYKNENTRSVYIPAGRSNNFTPAPKDRGQCTIFKPGREVRVFGVQFSGGDLVWMLNGRTITASKISTRCR